MFVALYEMKVKPGCEETFEASWARVTDAIYARRGSLGSRLHQTEQAGVYIAYAQWPAREAYFDDSVKNWEEHVVTARQTLRASTEYIKTLHLMTSCDDRLHTGTMTEPE